MSKAKSSVRKRISVQELKREAVRVRSFVVTSIEKSDGPTPVSSVFSAYKRWNPSTKLSIDGFGRLFPKTFSRKIAKINGRVQRVLVGAGLRK
jgi:hypothetical protein